MGSYRAKSRQDCLCTTVGMCGHVAGWPGAESKRRDGRHKREIYLCSMTAGSSFHFPGPQNPHCQMGLIFHSIVLKNK